MNREGYRPHVWSFTPISSRANLVAECNTIIFSNDGTQNVTINGVKVLTPGQSMTHEGYPGEINVTSYEIVFTNDLQPGCLLTMMCKEYL